MRFTSFTSGLTFAMLCLIGSAARPAAAQSYTFQDLGAGNPVLYYSQGLAVNNSGQVTGFFRDPAAGQYNRVFLTGPAGAGSTSFGTLGGTTSYSGGVNAAGQITGTSEVAGDASTHAFVSGPGNTLKDLGTFGGSNSYGQAINSTGQVTGGASFAGDNVTHAFLSAAGGGPLKDLGTLGGFDPFGSNYPYLSSYGQGVNDAGQVTGYSSVFSITAGYTNHAFLSDPNGGALHDLGTLVNTQQNAESIANAVNNHGQVVGFSSIGDPRFDYYATHAFVSDPNGGALHDLGSLGGSSGANGINDAGDVVGYYNLSSGPFGNQAQHAFLFTNGKMLDLNTLIGPNYAAPGFTMTTAKSISNSGFITGIGTSADGSTHAFLLTPEAVPEASTTVSLGLLLGLSGLAVVIKRRKIRAA